MSISRQDVLTVARLARLELDSERVDRMTRELQKILSYVDQLAQVDTQGVAPTAHVTVDRAPLRPDEVRQSLDRAEVLAAAPRSDQGGFLVPGFVDES